MGVGPISYLEIEAYQRLALVRMSAWEVGLLRRLDDAVRVVLAAPASRQGRQPEKITTDIPTTRPAALKSLFRGIAAERAADALKVQG